MDAISQTTLSNALSWTKMCEFRLRFHWSLSLGVQLTIFQHWLRWWLGADQATSHYLNQCWYLYRRIYASLGLNELAIDQAHTTNQCYHQRWRGKISFIDTASALGYYMVWKSDTWLSNTKSGLNLGRPQNIWPIIGKYRILTGAHAQNMCWRLWSLLTMKTVLIYVPLM